jgi:hypothetical protein
LNPWSRATKVFVKQHAERTLGVAERLCDKVPYLDRGQLIYLGSRGTIADGATSHAVSCKPPPSD